MKILIVDDDVQQLYLLERMLQGFGYEVAPARNGVEALQMLEQGGFELIIADILMPQMDGFELCYTVKQQEKFRQIPFIFYTATYTEKQDEELALSLGASRFIIKPAEPEVFSAIIREVVRQYEAGQLAPAAPATERKEVLLETYNQRLVRKLSQKVQQLEDLAQELRATIEAKDREVVKRREAEATVRQLNAELEQRVVQRTGELTVANQELESFTSAVAHDLRAPLRAIEGFSYVLGRCYAGQLDERGRSLLGQLQTETQRMGHFMEALLQLARATRGELRREPVDLSELARKIGEDLKREQPNRPVSLSVAPGLVASGDPVLLRAVLQNLLANAWKFTAQTPQPRIEFGQAQQGGRPAYFVRDNGVGFDMASAGRLFAPFQRLHEAAAFPGTGIGLASVRQIVRRHGGEVWAEGAVNQGATFYFTLP